MTDAATAPAQGAPHPHRLPLVAALVAVAVLVVGTIGPPLFGKGVFLAVDQLTLAYPWRAFDSPSALNVLHHGPATDTIDANHPTRVLSANALRDGHLFGWNPYPAGGTASASHSASGSLSPFGLLYVALPHSYAPAAAKLVQMLVAVGFTYLFCRRLGTGKVPAVFAGAVFGARVRSCGRTGPTRRWRRSSRRCSGPPSASCRGRAPGAWCRSPWPSG